MPPWELPYEDEEKAMFHLVRRGRCRFEAAGETHTLETGDFVFMTGKDSAKARMLRREARVSICVDVMEMPYDFARIDGVAAITGYEDDPDAIRHWAIETCRRFVGDDRAGEFGARNGGDDEILVRVTPTRYVGAFGVSD